MRGRLIWSIVLAVMVSVVPAGAATISFDDLRENADGSFSLDVHIVDAVDLTGFELRVSHDPLSDFEADVAAGDFEPFVVPFDATNSLVVGVLINPLPPLTGEGLLATLIMTLPGDVDLATMTFLSASLISSTQIPSEADLVEPSSVTLVRSTTPVPEPSTIMLLGVGLVGLTRRRLRAIRSRAQSAVG